MYPDWRRTQFEDTRTRGIRSVVAEFLGTLMFVFVGCCSLISGNIVAAALCHGLTIALLVMTVGKISGAHFNPVVTLGVFLGGGISHIMGAMYIVAQLVGGIIGAALVKVTVPANVYLSIMGGTTRLGQFADGPNSSQVVGTGLGVIIEVLLTFLLVHTVLLTTVDKQNKTNMAPLAIGFAVTVDILAGGLLTGASMNPARSFGPAVAAGSTITDAFKYHYVYWVGPIVGSLLASALYRYVYKNPEGNAYNSADCQPE